MRENGGGGRAGSVAAGRRNGSEEGRLVTPTFSTRRTRTSAGRSCWAGRYGIGVRRFLFNGIGRRIPEPGRDVKECHSTKCQLAVHARAVTNEQRGEGVSTTNHRRRER